MVAPWHAQEPIEIVAHDGGLGAHRAHRFQLLQLGLGLFAGLFRELGLLDAFFQLFQLRLAILTIAQLLLNGLHLLIQIILALGLLHLGFHPRFNLLLDLQNAHLALHVAIDLLQRHIHAQMPGHKVGQPRRLTGFGNGTQGFFGNVLADFGVAFEFVGHSTHQSVNRSLIAGVFRQTLRARFKE